MDQNKRIVRFTISMLLYVGFLSFYSEPIFGHFLLKIHSSDTSKLFDQETDQFDSALVTQQFKLIESLLRDQNNHEALKFAQIATGNMLKYEKWDHYVYGLLVQANGQSALLNFKHQKILIDSALNMAKIYVGENQRATATVYNDLALYHINQGDYLTGLKYMRKSVSIRRVILDSNDPSIGRSLNNLASIYGYLGDTDKEIELLQESVDIKIKGLGEYTDPVAIGFNNLAVAYRTKLDFIKALEYIEKVVEIDQKILPPNHPILAQDYNAISGIFLNLNNEKSALYFLDKAFTINTSKFGMNHPNTAKNMISYSNIYEKRKRFYKQLMYLEKSLEIRENVYGSGHHLLADVYSLLGSCYINLNQNEEAKASLLKALRIRQEVFGKNHHLVAHTHSKLAEFFNTNELYDSALFHVQRSLAALDSSYDFENIQQHSSGDLINSKEVYLEVLKNKAFSLDHLSNTQSDDNFRLSLETNLHSVELINELRLDFDSRLSDKIFLDNSYNAFEKTIDQSLALSEITNDPIWKEKAFQVSEMSKAFRLSKVLNEVKSKQFARIPDSLLIQEKYLKTLLTRNSESLIKEKGNLERSNNLKNLIFSHRRKLDSLMSQLEKNYPKYYELKYDKSQISLKDVQQGLNSNELFLEFFVGEKKIYSFAITKSQFKTYSFSKTPLFETRINEFRKSISDYRFISGSILHADTTYINSAIFLHNHLLKKALISSEEKIERIFIVPDSELGLINFEALLATEPKNKEKIDYKNLDYLINHYTISLAPSATILNQSGTGNTSTTKLYAGFAPLYADEYQKNSLFKSYSPADINLSGTIKEIEEVSEIFDGSKFVDTLATESKFKEVSGDFKLLHLAMHGIINENPNDVALIFSKKTDAENDGFLGIPEIYNLNLNADMIVLSACNSGFGTVQKGEGVLSLSRAFMYSGSPSVIMSLWALPDNTAPEIIGNFSRNILDGQMKNIALSQAKIDYINSVEDKFYAHPYFWAGLVAIGDMSTIKTQPDIQLKKILSIVAFLVLSAGLTIIVKRYK